MPPNITIKESIVMAVLARMLLDSISYCSVSESVLKGYVKKSGKPILYAFFSESSVEGAEMQ